MRTQLSKLALSASIMLAMAFTFSCSSGDDNNGGSSSGSGGSSSPSGGSGSFNPNSQVYNRDGSLFTGSGVIKIRANCIDGESGFSETLINAGNVTNGIVTWQLPQTIPDEYLGTIYNADKQQNNGCTEYPEGLRGLRDACGKDLIALVNSNLSADYINSNSTADYIGKLRIFENGNNPNQTIEHWYFSKAGKITCNKANNSGQINKANINATAGWNKIYMIAHNGANGLRDELSTDNILTKEVKWYLWY
jgi:hypothetical protein